jgi:hypothetical protein
MGKGIILGIDFSMDFTQMAYLDEDGNPQSISIGVEDNYLIPTAVCYNRGIKEWYAGDEACNKKDYDDCTFYDSLPKIHEIEVEDDREEILGEFFAYLFYIASKFCDGREVKSVLITLNEVSRELAANLVTIMGHLGIEAEDVKIISHSESFVYYVLNQNRDIWINKVLFLDFDRHDFLVRKLSVVRGRKPHVADVKTESLSADISMQMVEKDAVATDKLLAEHLKEELKKEVVSGIYLSGEGFYEGSWDNTIKAICSNRRVFKGNNLIVKGAAYGAKEFFHIPTLEEFLISCKGRTRVKIKMNVKYKEREHQVVLSNIGDNWYLAQSELECILENGNVADFEIHDILNHSREKIQISLKDFPERPAKTTRMKVKFRYIEENKIEFEITDLGFGEFFKSSGKVVRKEVTLYQQEG